jgi:hypothetical protein
MSDDEYMAKRKALVGKRFPVQGGTKQQGPNMLPRKPADAPAAPAKKQANFLNPKSVNVEREKEAGMACGGKVKRYASGGSVRGEGCTARSKKCKMV